MVRSTSKATAPYQKACSSQVSGSLPCERCWGWRLGGKLWCCCALLHGGAGAVSTHAHVQRLAAGPAGGRVTPQWAVAALTRGRGRVPVPVPPREGQRPPRATPARRRRRRRRRHHDGGGAGPLLPAGARRRPGPHPERPGGGRGAGGRRGDPAGGAGPGAGRGAGRGGRQDGALRPPARRLPAAAAAGPRGEAALRQAAEEVRQERRQSPAERMSLLGGRLARTGSSLLRSLRGGRAGGIAGPLEHRVSTSLSQKTAAISAFLGLNHHPRPYLRNLLDMHSPDPLPQPNSLDLVLFPAKISSAFQPLKSDGVKEMQGHGGNCGLTELKFHDRHALVF